MKAASGREHRRLKYAATLNDEALSVNTPADYELHYIDIGNVDSSGEIYEIATYRFENSPSRARRVVRDGDVIISTVRTYLQAIAPIVSPPDNLIVSTGFAVVRPLAGVMDPHYCKYALREPKFMAEVEARSTGVSYPAINASDLGDIRIELAPFAEQQRVAKYLDRETAEIDALIAEKQRMLALLEEKRVALVSKAVTRGLDPKAPLKPSSLDWVGEVPNHWSVRRMKTLVHDLQTGPFGSQLHAEEYTSEGIPVINPADIAGYQIVADKAARVDVATSEMLSRHRICQGDVIFARRGELGRCAKVGAEHDGWICGTGCLRVRLKTELLDPEFLVLVMANTTVSAFLNFESLGSTMDNLNTETIGKLPLPVPPIDEQRCVVHAIADENKRNDALAKALRESIGLLKERRAALITAAVTGQMPPEERTT